MNTDMAQVAQIIAPGPMAGAEQVVLHGAAALHQRGALHSLILINEVRAGGPAQQMADLAAARGLPVHVIDSRARLDLSLWGELERAARGASILHAHGAKALLYARAVAGERPLVATHHGELGRTSAELLYGVVQRSLYGTIDAVCCVSEAQRRQLARSTPGARCALIENFARHEEAPAPTDLPDAPFWLFAGRISEEKGLDLLLRALADAQVTTPLLIAGDGPQRAEMEQLARCLALRHVRFLGWRGDVPALVAAAQAVLLPSRREGMPMIALEAAAAGTPLLATMVGGLPEVVRHGEGGLLVPAEDVAALALALRVLERDAAALKRQAEAQAPAASQRFSVETWAAQTTRLYESLLTQRA